MNRHIKKYFFYVTGRFLQALGYYDRSLHFYAHTIRIRTFLFDVQNRYKTAFESGSRQCTFELSGGVGDFLQYLPFLLQNKNANYTVVTHFPHAKSFFELLGIKIHNYHFYKSREEHHLIKHALKKIKNYYPAPRQIFFDGFPFPSTQNEIYKDKSTPIIGLHMTPSGMTSNPLSKNFLDQLIKSLVTYPIKIVLFGTQSELSNLRLEKNDPLIIACHENIIENLSLVQYCDVMIGVDSVFKTMASMAKIPTVLFYEDIKSNFRDRVFINPYVENKIMYTYKYQYQSLEGDKIKPALDFIIDILKSKLKLITSTSISK